MKRVVSSTICALFAIVLISHFSIIHAQDIIVETETPVGVENNTSESGVLKLQRVNYELPYPGMLPDSPFYILKVMRDGMIKLLINDDMKMAKFNLLNAEKRVYAAKLLTDKNSDKIALETLSKGNNYLNDCVASYRKYQKSHPKNHDLRPFLVQIESSSEKLLEVQENMKRVVDDEYKTGFSNEHKRTEGIIQTVKSLLAQN